MVQTFLEPEPGSVRVFEAVHAETEGGVSAQDLVEELPALLDLEVVGSVERSLVDVGSEFRLNKKSVTSLVLPSPLLT